MIHVMRGDMDISAEFGEPKETVSISVTDPDYFKASVIKHKKA